jgi:hypothetical protein
MDMGPAKPKKRGRKSVKAEGADDEDEDASGFGSDGDSEDSDARQRRHEARRAEKAGDSVAGMLANEFKVNSLFLRFKLLIVSILPLANCSFLYFISVPVCGSQDLDENLDNIAYMHYYDHRNDSLQLYATHTHIHPRYSPAVLMCSRLRAAH